MAQRRKVPARSMLLRSFAIQGSWNYRTLIGTGFAFSLLPTLRVRYEQDPDGLKRALARHGALFNSHPYLAPMALGAVARLELEGADPALVERFKTAVRGSLGGLGDRLVWAGWRPVSLLLALLIFATGAPWWLAVGVYLAVYNAGHIGLRVWSLRLGLESGLHVGERLRTSLLVPGQRFLAAAGPFLVGAALPFALAGGLVGRRLPIVWTVAGLVAALLGLRFGASLRTPLLLLMGLFALVGLVLGSVP